MKSLTYLNGDDDAELSEVVKSGLKGIEIQGDAGMDLSSSFVSGENLLRVSQLSEQMHHARTEKINTIIDAIHELDERITKLEKASG